MSWERHTEQKLALQLAGKAKLIRFRDAKSAADLGKAALNG